MITTVTDYLVERLHQLGVPDIFGLPGDYNFNILSAIEKHPGVKWINCTNELNAGYAADGYARVKGFGAVVTTYAVGELSAINAIAGSFAENVPVIKIVGVPRTSTIKNNVILHHNFHKPNYHAFQNAYSNVVETTAFLDKTNAKDEIDRIIDVMIRTRKPVYVAIPIDVCDENIEGQLPKAEIKSHEANLKKVIEHIAEVVNKAKNPLILADAIVNRYMAKDLLNDLIETTNIATSTFLMGKSSIDEANKNFVGTYLGNVSWQDTADRIKNSDCIITIGGIFSDGNTGGFSLEKTDAFKIEIQSDYVIIGERTYSDVWIYEILAGLKDPITPRNDADIAKFGYPLAEKNNTTPLKENEIFPVLQNFLKENDLFVVDTGSLYVPSGLLKLPKNCTYLCQMLWASIGWATPAVFGAATADKSRRPILLTGEGAHQLTFQEVSNMLKYNIKPIIILVNNNGYTIERILSQDYDNPYNDVNDWDYTKIPEIFKGDYWSAKAATQEEFKKALEQAEIEQQHRLCYIELKTDKIDITDASKQVVENVRQKLNAVENGKEHPVCEENITNFT